MVTLPFNIDMEPDFNQGPFFYISHLFGSLFLRREHAVCTRLGGAASAVPEREADFGSLGDSMEV